MSNSILHTLIATCMTSMPVSLALIIREVCPSSMACLACRKSRESVRRHTFKTNKLVTHSPIFPCYDDNILLTPFNNFANQEVGEVSHYCHCPSTICTIMEGVLLCQSHCILCFGHSLAKFQLSDCWLCIYQILCLFAYE